jgi:hypothetical protein
MEPRLLFPLIVMLLLLVTAACAQPPQNLLLNSGFAFHCFDNSRTGASASYSANNVACWNVDAWGDARVTTTPHVDGLKTRVYTYAVVSLKPGKRFYQVIFLPEIGVRHGDPLSLLVYGQQKAPDSLRANIHVLKIDSQTGTWSPGTFKYSDTREFPKHSRGELVKAKTYSVLSGADTDFTAKVEGAEVIGKFINKNESGDDQINSIAVQIEFENVGKDNVLLYAPCLVKGPQALSSLPEMRSLPTWYRYIPRTIRKLWRGEALHVIVMGSSIDRGSANPPMYLYDENPASPTYKQPLSERIFDGKLVGRPDLDATIGWWQHYFSWAGRLRVELMTKFNYPPEKICFNFMACDGSCVSEATSGLADYCSLTVPAVADRSGQKDGKTWRELYPDLFTRPQGPGPDLVLWGSGANEKTDTPDEGAIFEGSIRWIQRHYPECEFLATMWQRARTYTMNVGHIQEIALGYQIPLVDLADRMDQLLGDSNPYALVPADGHPQAAAHYVWFKTIEQAFEVADPVLPGINQLSLPQRLHPNSYGWEGEVTTYTAPSPRFHDGRLLVLDDTTVNCWASVASGKATCYVDGEKKRESVANASVSRDIRNSTFAYGRLTLGDRHILELAGDKLALAAADCKFCPNRRQIGVDSKLWQLGNKPVTPYTSQWGTPFGSKQVIVRAGEFIELDTVGTDLAVAYVDDPNGGTFSALVDGQEVASVNANVPYTDATGAKLYFENRKGLRGLGYGQHRLRLEVKTGQVAFLSVVAYDARSNRSRERGLTGSAVPNESLTFSQPFAARPVVICSGNLAVDPRDVTTTGVYFRGTGAGTYQIIGE